MKKLTAAGQLHYTGLTDITFLEAKTVKAGGFDFGGQAL